MESRIDYLETDLARFNKWLKNLSENGKVSDIAPEVVRGVLESCGANFEISEDDKKALRKYTNKGKRQGLDAVWGKGKVDAFKDWLKSEYIPYVEERAGRELPTLWDPKTKTFDDIKHSGMMQFLGELTALAAGEVPIGKYREFTEDRYRKGKKWEFGDRMEPYRPTPHSAFPVDFPLKALDRIRAVI